MSKDVDLGQVLGDWLDFRLEAVHTMIPAIIETYDRATRKAQVLPAIKLLCATGASVPYKPLLEVQVIMQGGTDWDIDCELIKGDGGLLMISEASLGTWLASDGTEQVDADDPTRFSLQDAFFLPGVWPWGKIPSGRPSAGLFLRYKDSKLTLADSKVTIEDKAGGKLEIDGGLLNLANSVSNMKAEMGKLWDAIKDVNTNLVTHMHPTAAVGPPSPPANAAAFTTASVAAGANKTAVGSLLK